METFKNNPDQKVRKILSDFFGIASADFFSEKIKMSFSRFMHSEDESDRIINSEVAGQYAMTMGDLIQLLYSLEDINNEYKALPQKNEQASLEQQIEKLKIYEEIKKNLKWFFKKKTQKTNDFTKSMDNTLDILCYMKGVYEEMKQLSQRKKAKD